MQGASNCLLVVSCYRLKLSVAVSQGDVPFYYRTGNIFLLLPIVITQNGSIIRSYVRNIRQCSDIKWIFISASEPLVERRVVFIVRKEAKSFELQRSTEIWHWNSGICHLSVPTKSTHISNSVLSTYDQTLLLVRQQLWYLLLTIPTSPAEVLVFFRTLFKEVSR